METLALLKKLVQIPSVFPKERRLAEWIEQYLVELRYTVERVYTAEDRFSLVATTGSADQYLGLYGHMDTVPADPRYAQDPFTVQVDGSIARGLGVCDMKGGITIILQAAAYAAHKKLPLKLVFGVDEEDISQGAHDLVTSGKLKNIGFLIAAESGQVKDVSQAFSVSYGRKGRILYRIVVTGTAAHAAESEKGLNAIYKAATLLKSIERIKFRKHPVFGATNIVPQYVLSESDSFSVPDRAEIRCSLLTTPYVKGKDFEARVRTIAKKTGVELEMEPLSRKTPYGESYEVSSKNAFVSLLEKKIFIPHTVSPAYMASVADENVFANRLGIPVISVGPTGGGDHTKDEWVSIPSLLTLGSVYTQIVELFSSL